MSIIVYNVLCTIGALDYKIAIVLPNGGVIDYHCKEVHAQLDGYLGPIMVARRMRGLRCRCYEEMGIALSFIGSECLL